jgi:hypothetical protein
VAPAVAPSFSCAPIVTVVNDIEANPAERKLGSSNDVRPTADVNAMRQAYWGTALASEPIGAGIVVPAERMKVCGRRRVYSRTVGVLSPVSLQEPREPTLSPSESFSLIRSGSGIASKCNSFQRFKKPATATDIGTRI